MRQWSRSTDRRIRRNARTPTYMVGEVPEPRPDPEDRPRDTEQAVQVDRAPVRRSILPEPYVDRDGDPDMQPVVPRWLADWRTAVPWRLHVAWHLTRFHGIRVPAYVWRAFRWTPRGLWRAAVGAGRWASDWEAQPLRDLAIESGDIPAHVALARLKDNVWRSRRWVLVLGFVGLALLLIAATQNPTVRVLTAAAVVWVGVRFGHPVGERFIEPAVTVTASGARIITGELIREAFDAAGLSKPPRVMADGTLQGGKEIAFVREIARKGRHGTETAIDLPIGTTAEHALKRKAEIASGLSVGRMQLRITPDPESERRIGLYIHDFDPFAQPPQVTPLADVAKVDFWEGLPFGTSAEGEEVRVNMLWTNLLVGAIMRSGKTFSIRPIAAAAALDPTVRLVIFDGAGRASWSDFESVCHRYGVGERETVKDHLVEVLRECWEDIQTRNETLDKLPRERVPEAKITRDLARDRKLNMPLTMLVIDEVQQYLIDNTRVAGRKRGDLIRELLTNIIKLGPAVGYMAVIATQKPGGDVIPTDFRDQFGSRFALRMATREGSRTILGDIPPGMDPVQFTRRHTGVGVLTGANEDHDDAMIVRAYLMDDDLTAIIDRAHKLRTGLGLLTGHSAGEHMADTPPDRLLDDILTCVAIDEDKLWTTTILDRIVAAYPDLYDGWSIDHLRTCLRDLGIKTSHQISRVVEDRQINQRGVLVDDIKAALARQNNGDHA